jgi:UTP--glucose-1-phosphate uridylyltransferase
MPSDEVKRFNMMNSIKKAVFPVAGLGTRFLPVTKASPKEMLPIADKPLIQYAVEEAIAAGITELIFVTSSSKRAIEDHFDTNYELEAKLAKANKHELLAIVRQVLPKGVSCAYIRQPDTLGLGHAVLCAQPLINNEPFAVLLADDLIDGNGHSCLEQMVAVYQETKGSVIAVQEIPPTDTNKYGIVGCSQQQGRRSKVEKIIEKPESKDAPSNLAVVGRYILDPSIFNYLTNLPAGKGGEIQLTDAIAQSLAKEKVYAWQFNGTRYDCGSKLGYLQAIIAYALKHPEIGKEFGEYLKNFIV